MGPTLSFRGLDNATYYRLVPGRPAPATTTHGHRQHPQRRAPPDLAADHGLAALLGDGDARGRFPLRPGGHSGPRSSTRSTGSPPSSTSSTGPGHQPGQAHRRAVGRRARAATRWATSRCAGRSGTAATATPSGTTGAAKPAIGEFAYRLTGSSDLYERDRPAPVGQRQLRHRPRRLHPGRPRQLQRKHNEANGEANKDGDRRQPLVELRRRGPDR